MEYQKWNVDLDCPCPHAVDCLERLGSPPRRHFAMYKRIFPICPDDGWVPGKGIVGYPEPQRCRWPVPRQQACDQNEIWLGRSGRSQRVAAHDQPFQAVGVKKYIVRNDQGAEAVSVEEEWDPHKMGGNIAEKFVDVVPVIAPRIDMPVQSAGAPVASRVECSYCESLLEQPIDEICVTARVLADSVNERHDSANSANGLPRLQIQFDATMNVEGGLAMLK